MFTAVERAVISELLQAMAVCASSDRSEVRAVAALLAERASRLLRGETTPYTMSDEQIAEFAANAQA